MPPKKSTTATPTNQGGAAKPRGAMSSGRARGGRANSSRSAVRSPVNDGDIVTIDSDSPTEREVERAASDDENMDSDEEPPQSIPPELITRLLHEFFEKEGTRMTKSANEAVTKYIDVFVREAVARAAAEKADGFLEVEDLERIAPQLLLDL